MRTKDKLISMEDVATLMQYLYMDEDNSITIKNIMNVPLKIQMDDNFLIMVTNLNYPDLAPMNQSDITMGAWINIIEWMKEQPHTGTYSGAKFTSYWDEVWTITRTQLSLNRNL